MKKAITLTLLPVFLFGIIGWQWMFMVKLYTHEFREWRSVSENETLEKIIIHSHDGKRDSYFINANELVHQGKLYDVKHKEIKDGDLICYCERDGSEENLLASFNLKTTDHFGTLLSSKANSQKVVKLSVFQVSEILSMHVHAASGTAVNISDKVSLYQNFCCNSVFVPPDVA